MYRQPLFLGITACRVFVDKFPLLEFFVSELSPHFRLFPMVRPLLKKSFRLFLLALLIYYLSVFLRKDVSLWNQFTTEQRYNS